MEQPLEQSMHMRGCLHGAHLPMCLVGNEHMFTKGRDCLQQRICGSLWQCEGLLQCLDLVFRSLSGLGQYFGTSAGVGGAGNLSP